MPIKENKKTVRTRSRVGKLLQKKLLPKNPFLALEEHRREEVGTRKQGYFFIVDAPDWVNIMALTEEKEIVLIEQFRHGSDPH